MTGGAGRAAGSERGQLLVAVMALIPAFVLALFITVDLGRYQYLRSQTRIMADSAALAAAGALDIQQAGRGNFVLNKRWARQRAEGAMREMTGRVAEDDWMTFLLASVSVEGAQAEVTVIGQGDTIFGRIPLLGITGFKTAVSSRARAAVGVEIEQ